MRTPFCHQNEDTSIRDTSCPKGVWNREVPLQYGGREGKRCSASLQPSILSVCCFQLFFFLWFNVQKAVPFGRILLSFLTSSPTPLSCRLPLLLSAYPFPPPPSCIFLHLSYPTNPPVILSSSPQCPLSYSRS